MVLLFAFFRYLTVVIENSTIRAYAQPVIENHQVITYADVFICPKQAGVLQAATCGNREGSGEI
jgi:hypothetical protein